MLVEVCRIMAACVCMSTSSVSQVIIKFLKEVFTRNLNIKFIGLEKRCNICSYAYLVCVFNTKLQSTVL